jgi:hypothetical protein
VMDRLISIMVYVLAAVVIVNAVLLLVLGS